MYGLTMNTLSLIFLWSESKILEKNVIKIRVGNLVKQKLWLMDAYDGAATEQQVALLKKTWNWPYNTLIYRHRKTEVGNPLKILENHQSYET